MRRPLHFIHQAHIYLMLHSCAVEIKGAVHRQASSPFYFFAYQVDTGFRLLGDRFLRRGFRRLVEGAFRLLPG